MINPNPSTVRIAQKQNYNFNNIINGRWQPLDKLFLTSIAQN